jgi:hypothetical protein
MTNSGLEERVTRAAEAGPGGARQGDGGPEGYAAAWAHRPHRTRPDRAHCYHPGPRSGVTTPLLLDQNGAVPRSPFLR